MSILKDKFITNRTEKENINKKIKETHVQPTEQEQNTAQDIIRKVSEQYAEELISKDISDISNQIAATVREYCNQLDLTYEEQKRIEKTVLSTVLGHGPIEPLLQDNDVSEIVVQKYDNIVYEKDGIIHKSEVSFVDENHLRTIINRIVQKAGRQINIMTPIVDARLEDGSRVNATIPPVSPDGATLTIRKFNNKALSGNDYLALGSLNRPMLYFLNACVRGRISIFVSGGTGTGKTTLLNMLSAYVPSNELIITIEDTCELKLQQPNVRRMEVRSSTSSDMLTVDQKILVRNALRQRPDRIILGETRDGSIVDLISAMSSGHDGSISTIHANDPENMCNVRIPILYSMNKDVNFSEKSIAMQISEAIQVIVQIKRFPDGSRKISQISCVEGLDENDKVKVVDIFRYDKNKKGFIATGYVPRSIIKKIRSQNIPFQESIFEVKRGEKNA